MYHQNNISSRILKIYKVLEILFKFIPVVIVSFYSANAFYAGLNKKHAIHG